MSRQLKYIRVDSDFQKMFFENCNKNLEEVYKNIYQNYKNDFKEEYNSPAIIFVGLNVKGGIEQSTRRYIEQLLSTYKDLTLIHFYEQGIPNYQIEELILQFLKMYRIKYIILNEQSLRYQYAIQEIKRILQQFGIKLVLIYIAQQFPSETLFEQKSFDDCGLIIPPRINEIDIIFTPVVNTYKKLKQILKNKPIYYIPFIQSQVQQEEIKKYQEREIKLLVQKRFTSENFEQIINLTQQILNAFPYFEDSLWVIKFNESQSEFYEQFLSIFPKQKIIDQIPEEDVKYLYNSTQFILHTSKSELFSITQIDGMQNGQIPIYLPVQDGDFGKLYQTLGYGIYKQPHETMGQLINRLEQFLQLPNEEKDKYIISMRNQILNKYNSDIFISIVDNIFSNI